ncbi:hypothetical protein [Secundilactobacillus odoratitofui]|uniref:hypothetical protein n=1 Tax=Secundilactobacillus odoratitofui TaxID=480930 RepID=UPI0006D0FEF6|nr:hypothetical protein [Secundilactobacillus odoratitofui]
MERPIEVSAKEIENPQFDISTFQILQLWYLKQSLKYQIFEYEYLNSHQSTRKHFWKTHYSSQARYYVLRTEIDELLAEDVRTLNRSNSIQLQPELVMRISLTNIYYHFFWWRRRTVSRAQPSDIAVFEFLNDDTWVVADT